MTICFHPGWPPCRVRCRAPGPGSLGFPWDEMGVETGFIHREFKLDHRLGFSTIVIMDFETDDKPSFESTGSTFGIFFRVFIRRFWVFPQGSSSIDFGMFHEMQQLEIDGTPRCFGLLKDLCLNIVSVRMMLWGWCYEDGSKPLVGWWLYMGLFLNFDHEMDGYWWLIMINSG